MPPENTSSPPRSFLTTEHQLLGTAGTYFVMSELTARSFHASCTFGNAPHVDILVSNSDGSKCIAVQVKTAEYAKRFTGKKREGKKLTRLEWFLGKKAATANLPNLFVVFVDFDKWSMNPQTDCYIIPSTFLFEFCKEWVASAKMVRFHPSPETVAPFKGSWNLIAQALQ